SAATVSTFTAGAVRRIWCAVSSSRAALRPVSTRDMPRSASRAASPRPSPDDAPLTTAQRPLNWIKAHLLLASVRAIEARDRRESHHPVEVSCDNTSDGPGG